ncbi:MAG TPA: hypothetical protein VMC03_05750 [Streptosporangiaceae bacterium]|nr:hypothetical protein [Streptosporangiaceae bacterium]
MAGDRVRLSATLRAQEAVISRRQALACGVTRSFLTHRLRPDGPWQRLCPGVYLAQTGAPSVPQKEMAALLHAGPGSVLTGAAALYGLGLTDSEPARFDVLVPRSRRRESVAFISVRRSARIPQRVIRNGRRQYALPPRAFADAARGLTELGEVRALIAGAVQQGLCPLPALVHELGEGPIRQSALLRQVLAEVAVGVRSGPEGDFRDLIRRSGLPEPMFNARLYAADGSFIACPDAWWKDAGVAGEVDSREWHLGPDGWQRTLRRHATMSACGILVLHFTPAQIRSSPEAVVAKVADALKAGRARGALPITARPAS